MTTIGLDIFARDRASAEIAAAGKSSAKAAADIEAANLRVEAAAKKAAAAEAKYGKESLEARTAANRLTQAQLGLQRSMSAAEKSTKQSVTTVERFRGATTAAYGLAGTAVAAFGARAVRMASDLEQSTGGAQAVFGKFSDQVIAKSKQAADAVGLSQDAYLTQAALLGSLLKNQGVAIDQLVPKTDALIRTAADLSATYGGTATDAVEALTAAFKGEFDPLQRYGISLTAATISTEAMAVAHVKTTSAFDQLTQAQQAQAKMQATTNLLQRQGADAAGQFAKQTGTTAEQAQIARAKFENMTAELGTKLLPAVTSVLSTTVKLSDAFGENKAILIPLAGGLATLAGTIWAVNKASAGVEATKKAWDTLSGAIGRTGKTAEGGGRSITGLAGALGGPWMLAATAGVTVLGLWAKKQADSKARVDELRDSLDEQTGAITDNSRAIAFKNLADSGAIKSAKQLGISIRDVTDAALGNAEAQDRVNAVLDHAATPYKEYAANARGAAAAGNENSSAVNNLRGALGTQNKELERARQAYNDASAAGLHGAEAAKLAASGVDTFAQSQKDAAAETQKATDKLRAHANALLELGGDEDAFQAAVDDATQALKDNGRNLDASSEKGRNNRQALRTLASTTLAWRDASKEAGDSQAVQNGIIARGREQIIQMAIKYGMGKKAAREYADSVLGLPKRHTTDFKANTKPARTSVQQYREWANTQLDAIHDEKVTVTVASSWKASRVGSKNLVPFGDGEGVSPGSGGHGAHPLLSISRSGPPGSGDGDGSSSTNLLARTPSRGSVASLARGLQNDADDMAAMIAKQLSSLGGALGNGSTMGWRNQWAIIHRAFPGAHLNSSYRPGARTVLGNQSYHALGRAIDVTPSMAIFDWIRQNYGARTKELIYSPAGNRQLKDGHPHYYRGAVRAMHFNHVHWAMKRGGRADGPTTALIGEAGPERVLDARTTRNFEQLVRVIDRRPQIVSGGDPGQSIDYQRLGASVARALDGMAVQLDGRTVGRVQGQRADLIRRGG